MRQVLSPFILDTTATELLHLPILPLSPRRHKKYQLQPRRPDNTWPGKVRSPLSALWQCIPFLLVSFSFMYHETAETSLFFSGRYTVLLYAPYAENAIHQRGFTFGPRRRSKRASSFFSALFVGSKELLFCRRTPALEFTLRAAWRPARYGAIRGWDASWGGGGGGKRRPAAALHGESKCWYKLGWPRALAYC